jgi:outer membrane protein insertion porin family
LLNAIKTKAKKILWWQATLKATVGVVGTWLALSGCTGLGRLSEEQYLVSDYKVRLEEKDSIEHYKKLKAELYGEIQSKPNGKILWMRPRLAIHNTFSKPKKDKGFVYWLKYKLGKAPVLLNETYCQQLDKTFENRLYHHGYFKVRSSMAIEKRKKTAQVFFDVHAGQPYKIDTLLLPTSNDTISRSILSVQHRSLIVPGQVYDLQILKDERSRIEGELRNRGFYYFNQEYLKFMADTTNGKNLVKLKLALKDDAPLQAQNVFNIDKVYVTEDFRLKNYQPDTTSADGYQVISASNYMKPRVFLNSVLYGRDSLYSKRLHNNSLKQLMGLRAYKYVNIHYTPASGSSNLLDVRYSMTPAKKMSISAELNAVSKSNSFAGPGVKLSFNSKNFFRGAEFFSVNMVGRFEKQISRENQGDTAYEISVDASLDVPHLVPFKLKKRNHPYLPKSNIILGTGLFARVSLYRFNTFTAGLAYTWRKNDAVTHIFKPIDISATNLLDATAEFKEFLLYNPSIRQSFEEQFIIGMAYNYIINKLPEANRRRYYLNIGVDPSGNLAAAINRLLGYNRSGAENPVKVFGQPVSQFFRIRTDFRYYFRIGKESLLATRMYTGVGVPYGNSQVMPYVRQFFAGGTNSMRAFRARSLGPGSYQPPDSLQNVLVDQTGEIRLEANLEYRFPIAGFLKGSLFTDIGNVWLVNQDTLRPGGQFHFDTFHTQIAVGTGFGLRIDLDLMVLRFDWAFPIRKPWLPEGERWVINEIDLWNRRWRRENMILNISIGYPF